MIPSRPNGVLNHGNPGVRVRTLGRVGDQHVQVRDGASDDFVVNGVRTVDARGAGARFLQGMAGGAHLPVEQTAAPFALRRAREADAREYPTRRAGLQRYLEGRSGRGQRLRRRRERNLRDPLDLIKSLVAEHDAVIAHERGVRFAAGAAVLAPHLEKVREVGREAVRQAQAERAVAEISHHQALVAGAVPDELHAVQMNVFPPQCDLAVLEQIRVAEVRREHGVVVLDPAGVGSRGLPSSSRFLEALPASGEGRVG